ncbi:MAG TPA: hypothetical protein DEP32_02365 [Pseudomonas sp.]|uniref:hypothetical protein n=1 Tax=Pseudomonas sp. TaxID=306 RepID=UPI000C67FDFC|nr:hypothetical protein [Pseudomonas sp.]MBB49409.1 hypothetical protein [Pseudomonadales bacterium]MBF78215.1 hypothetical protein [Pseudomonadales bacterium]MBU30767.1 hypothetical protein [Pseudomonadales bacterium]HCA22985.1 hypothetical protein [Pseudomonas sp.]|tara:strand:- start:5816 stop:6220 length:405 start_codon:yes stop_codon:yes gene_type:complete
MFRSLICSAVLGSILLTQPALAQEPADNTAQADDSSQAQDIGTLQAELARVEAERQRLADQLDGGAQGERVEQLQSENQQLRNDNQAARLDAQARLIKQQQRWFLIGGLSVAASILMGFVLARMGRQKRREWLN